MLTAIVTQKERLPQTRGPKGLAVSGLLLASIGLIGLGLWPEFDLAASAVFFAPPGHFAGMTAGAQFFRSFAGILPFAIYSGALLLYIAGFARFKSAPRAMSHRAIIFLTLSFALGPGLLVNQVFKVHFHRPRPVHVAEFGGGSPFRPFYRRDGDCPQNCSFPSGESAAAFWTVAPAAFAPPPLRLAALAGAIGFGAVTGLFRMAAGAHFLSDILASGLITGLTEIGLWFLIRPGLAPHVTEAQAGLREDLAPL